MNIASSPPSGVHWYNILILLPLVILQNLAYGFTSSSVVETLRNIECGPYPPGKPRTPSELCQEPSVLDAFRKDAVICIGITNILAILVSGIYAHQLDANNRRKAMGFAAGTHLFSTLWGVFARKSTSSLWDVCCNLTSETSLRQTASQCS